MEKKEKWNLELTKYIKQGEPTQVEKTKVWETAIGLQDVDGLKPSKYLVDTANEHIEGKINLEDGKERINNYYQVVIKTTTDKSENYLTSFIRSNEKEYNRY